MSIQGISQEFSLEMVYNCISYTLAASGEYWIIDWLNYLFDIRLPVLSAMLQNGSWPIQLVTYKYQLDRYNEKNEQRVITRSMYRSYCILGLLNTVVSISRTVGLTTLPPTLYVIMANTEIIFEAFMSSTILGRKLNVWQYTSISFVLAGVVIALYNPVSHKFGSYEHISDNNLMIGVFVSLLSRFVSSLNTVLADR
jgi:drug/metabolite transporter (DMT)-like permease